MTKNSFRLRDAIGGIGVGTHYNRTLLLLLIIVGFGCGYPSDPSDEQLDERSLDGIEGRWSIVRIVHVRESVGRTAQFSTKERSGIITFNKNYHGTLWNEEYIHARSRSDTLSFSWSLDRDELRVWFQDGSTFPLTVSRQSGIRMSLLMHGIQDWSMRMYNVFEMERK